MTIDCRLCRNWFDHYTEPDPGATCTENSFYGCRIFGLIENFREMADCPHYQERSEPYVLCPGCGVMVPRVCMLLGECTNCVDTDLFCQEQCTGGTWRKTCSHWVRLGSEGRPVVQEDRSVASATVSSPPVRPDRRPSLKQVYLRYLGREKKRSP
ncbi:MAG: hypothetical protein JXQ27_18210 [Acidobacteria bacterium]|nr:hypothetical protein [Acidobacteriota bacterium]